MESEGCYIGRSWSTRGDARSSVFLRSARSRPCSGSKALTRISSVDHIFFPSLSVCLFVCVAFCRVVAADQFMREAVLLCGYSKKITPTAREVAPHDVWLCIWRACLHLDGEEPKKLRCR